MDASLQHLVARLDAAETDELRREFQAGGLRWLAPRLGPVFYRELGARIDGGDLRGVRSLLAERGLLPASATTATTGAPGGDLADAAGRDRPWWMAMLVIVAVLALAVVALSRCGERTAGGVDSLATRIADQPDLTTLAGLLDRFGLTGTLQGPGPLTVFAPTDRAFAALPLAQFAALRAADASVMRAVLAAHTVAGDLPASSLETGTLTSTDGRRLDVQVDAGTVRVGPARVTLADLRATNGVVHAVDLLLVDPDLLIPQRTRPTT